MWFTLNTCFPSRSFEFCLRDQPPVTSLGAKSLIKFPSRKVCTCCHNSFAGGMRYILCKPTWRGLVEDCSWFSSALTLCLLLCCFSFVSFVINLSHENKYMLSLVNPSREIFKHGSGFRNLPQYNEQLFQHHWLKKLFFLH